MSGLLRKTIPRQVGVNSDNLIERLSVKRMKPDKLTGSRYSDGNVPNVNWDENYGKLHVNRYNPDNANDNLRARVEVSKKEIPHNAGFLW